jgi:hypothetical protein
MTTIFWILQKQKIHENVDESTDELERLKNWISDAIASSLFQLVEKIRIYLMNFHLFNIQDEKLRNHILYVQQIETYLLLKYVIFRDDIDFFFSNVRSNHFVVSWKQKVQLLNEDFVHVLIDEHERVHRWLEENHSCQFVDEHSEKEKYIFSRRFAFEAFKWIRQKDHEKQTYFVHESRIFIRIQREIRKLD